MNWPNHSEFQQSNSATKRVKSENIKYATRETPFANKRWKFYDVYDSENTSWKKQKCLSIGADLIRKKNQSSVWHAWNTKWIILQWCCMRLTHNSWNIHCTSQRKSKLQVNWLHCCFFFSSLPKYTFVFRVLCICLCINIYVEMRAEIPFGASKAIEFAIFYLNKHKQTHISHHRQKHSVDCNINCNQSYGVYCIFYDPFGGEKSNVPSFISVWGGGQKMEHTFI